MKSPSRTPARQAAVLEITPRAAKIAVASTAAPGQVERVNASTLADHGGGALAALKALLEQPLGVREVGLLFGREVFSLQRLELPSVDPKEISSMLELQLGKLTPYPRSEILFSYLPVGSVREGYTTVLLAISRKTLIDGVLQFCKAKGVTAQWVGVSTEGLEAWWKAAAGAPPMPPGQLVAVVDVDCASTDCAIFSPERQLLFTQSIPIGAEQLVSSEPAKLRWLGELVRLPRILGREDVKGQIGRGILTGASEGLGPVAEQLAGQWGVAVDVMDALQAVSSEAVRAKARLTRVSYTALVGALQLGRPPRIDLIPHETRVSQALHVRSKHLERLVVNVALVIGLGLLLYGERLMLLGRYDVQLQQRLSPLEHTANEIQQQQHAMQRIHSWLDPSRSALGALQAVALAAGTAVTITQLSFKDGEAVKIRGTATSSQAPYEFLNRLKTQRATTLGSSCLAEVRVTGTRGAEFDITCAWKGA